MIIVNKMHQQFMAARRAGTPLIAIKSLDPEATIQALQSIMTVNVDLGWVPTPIIQHDCINGWMARNDEGRVAIDKALEGKPLESTVNAIEMLILAGKLPFSQDADRPTNPILFVLNAHSYIDRSYGARADFIQALWNLRLPFRDSLRSVVLIGPDFDFPPEIRHDILILDEPLPTDDQITKIVSETCEAAGIKTPEPEIVKAVDALRGLVAFEAEQATAICISPKNGLDTAELWQRKKQLISATKGLTVWVGGQKFNSLGGLDEIKKRLRRRIAGSGKPRVIVWIDEIEKAMAGSGGGDLSGVSSDQLGMILGEMSDKEYAGILLVGVMGAAKSAFAKAIASEAECITVKLDLGGAKGEGLMGQAENSIREVWKVIEAVGGFGGALIVATSNDIRVIKPELKRRMTLGIWYFDIPTEEEKKTIVEIYKARYPSVDASLWKKVNSKDWTGAEIEVCFKTAHEDGVDLVEASRSIIPVAVSGKDDIARLRQEAAGRYNSTNYPGPYRSLAPSTQTSQVATPGRKFAQGE